VRLLLDVHHSPAAAKRLCAGGSDVLAACEDRSLTTLPDDEILRAATADQQALVSENAKDFDRIVRSSAATGEHHAGVIFTSPRRFHRGRATYPEDLVTSLTRLLLAPPTSPTDSVMWLQ